MSKTNQDGTNYTAQLNINRKGIYVDYNFIVFKNGIKVEKHEGQNILNIGLFTLNMDYNDNYVAND